MAGPGNILITVGADTANAVRNLGNVHKALGETATTGEKMSAGLKKAALPAAAALGAIGVAGLSMAKAAMEDAKSADHLAGVLKRTTGAGDDAVSGMEDWISSTSKATGVTDDELRPAIEKLATATHSTTKAQELANKALDISAATGKDVDTVSTALAKGYQGQTAAMAKLVPGLSEGARKSKDFEVIMGELAKTTGGAAADAAQTAAGKMARLEVATGELQESIGYALLPVIEAIIPVMIRMADFAEDNVTVIKILVGVVATLAGGILAANAALKLYEAGQVAVKVATTAWTAVQWLLNAALDANPIGLVVVAIAGLAAGIVIAYNKSETFRDIVQGALHAVEKAAGALADAFTDLFHAAQAAFNWIVDHWKLALFAFGPIGAAIYAIVTNWDKVTAAAQGAVGAVKTAVDAIAGSFATIGDAIGRAADAVADNCAAIGRAFARAADAIADAAHRAMTWIGWLAEKAAAVIDTVQDLLHWIEKIPTSIHLPSIPHLPGWIPHSLPELAGVPTARGAGSSSSSAPVTINVYGALDPEAVARQIRRLLEQHDRRQGLRA